MGHFGRLWISSFLLLLASCQSAEDEAADGTRGQPCVGGDLCDYGLACVDGTCQPGPWGIRPEAGSAGAAGGAVAGAGGTGAVAGASGAGASGGSGGAFTGGSAGVGTGASGGVSSGGSGGVSSGGSGGVSSGGSGAAAGGSAGADAGVGGSGGTGVGGTGGSVSCVGVPAFGGRCSPTLCLCVDTNECFPFVTASVCCPTAPQCN